MRSQSNVAKSAILGVGDYHKALEGGGPSLRVCGVDRKEVLRCVRLQQAPKNINELPIVRWMSRRTSLPKLPNFRRCDGRFQIDRLPRRSTMNPADRRQCERRAGWELPVIA